VGADDGFVTTAECAGARIPDAPLPVVDRGVHLRACGSKLLSLPTFFAAAKKVGAAPHRGNANKPIRIQGKANTKRTTKKTNNEKTNNKKNEQRKNQAH
jgi:general secretion pathway protein K